MTDVMERHEAVDAEPAIDVAAIQAMAAEAGQVAVMVTDVSGTVTNLSDTMNAQAAASARLRGGAAQLRRHGEVVLESAVATRDEASATNERATGSLADVRSAFDGVTALAAWVTTAMDRFSALADRLESLVRTTGRIDSIARETHILALNARIEAARSGSAGAGFQVIADSVRDLANQTLALAREITGSLVTVGAEVTHINREGDGAREMAETVHVATSALSDSIESIAAAVASMEHRARQIAESAQQSASQLVVFVEELDGFGSGVESASASLAEAGRRSSDLADLGERLLQLSIRTGVTTVDVPFVELARTSAARVSELFEAAVRNGEISMADLFDERYVPIPGSDPEQHMTRFVAFTDRVLPEIQEAIVKMDDKITFSACVDRNGFLPTHNLVFSKAQGPDPVWNTANCRNRRIFNDKAGLRAGRTSAGVLLQTYRRDMGGGRFIPMKEVDAAITVDGRHWGALRLAYRAG